MSHPLKASHLLDRSKKTLSIFQCFGKENLAVNVGWRKYVDILDAAEGATKIFVLFDAVSDLLGKGKGVGAFHVSSCHCLKKKIWLIKCWVLVLVMGFWGG